MVDVRKGVLTPEQEDFLAQVLDDVFKFKNPLIETFDKTVFKALIKVGDDTQLDKINESWKLRLIPIIDAAILKDIENVRVAVTELLNEKVDVPVLDEEQEFLLFDALTKFIAAAIEFYLNKQVKKV